MEIKLVKTPSNEDWLWVKQCAVGTKGLEVVNEPSSEWKHRILKARHSPIRELVYKYEIADIPYWITVHLVRHHVGVNFYVQSQRNDRQDKYDRTKAPQGAPINMRISINAEALMNLANKRLCNQASKETQAVVREMCKLAEEATPELKGLLVPMCEYGRCNEMYPCGKVEVNHEA